MQINEVLVVSYAALVAAVETSLQQARTFEGKPVWIEANYWTPGLARFVFRPSRWSDLGGVTVRDMGGGKCELLSHPPEWPNAPDQRRQEAREAHAAIVAALWERLQDEGLWPKETEKRGAPRLEERDDWAEKCEKVQRVQARIRQGTPQEVACQLEGIPASTYRRLKNRIAESPPLSLK